MNAFFARRLWLLALPAVLLLLLAACTAAPSRPSPADVPAALSQQSLLAAQLGRDVKDVTITAVEAVTWPDACLGAGSAVEACALVETPGHRFTLSVGGKRYVYHSNADGSHVRLASAPEPSLEGTILIWSGNDETGCQTAHVSGDRVAFGRCYSPLISARLVNDDRRADLVEFSRTFAPFSADTPAGTVEFNGAGATPATPAQQRMLAEWARLVHQEANLGRSGASWGLALAWHREGGVAGHCNDVSVYRDGTVFANHCGPAAAQPVNRFRLGASDLANLYSWLDTYANFEKEWDSQAATDRLITTLVFTGQGAETAHEPDMALISDFALNLFLEGTIAAAPAPAACPGPEAGQQLLVDPNGQYCALYPAQYSLWNYGPNVMEIISRTVMNHVTPRLSIVSEPADGRALEDAAAALLAEYALPAFENQPEPLFLGNTPAILIDNMPGADLTRRVLAIHNDRLFTLFVAPLGDPDSPTRQKADDLYNQVAATFRFLGGDGETGVNEAIVDSLEVNSLESFPVQVQAVIRGHLPDACSFVKDVAVDRADATFLITLTTDRHPNMRCAQVLTPFEEVVALDVKGLPAGDYEVRLDDLISPFTLGADNAPSDS